VGTRNSEEKIFVPEARFWMNIKNSNVLNVRRNRK
jgi:hypothetical protein